MADELRLSRLPVQTAHLIGKRDSIEPALFGKWDFEWIILNTSCNRAKKR